MKPLICLLSTLALAAPLAAGPISQGDRQRALSELYASRKLFLDSIEGLTPAQWNFKPAPGAWSIGEAAEHVALTEDAGFDTVKKALAGPAEPGRKLEIADEALLEAFRDRSSKALAPESLQPKRRWKSAKEVAAHFRERRDRTLDYVRETQDDLRAHTAKHPRRGNLDAYQWIMGIAGHTERHVDQIREIMANPKFPKK